MDIAHCFAIYVFLLFRHLRSQCRFGVVVQSRAHSQKYNNNILLIYLYSDSTFPYKYSNWVYSILMLGSQTDKPTLTVFYRSTTFVSLWGDKFIHMHTKSASFLMALHKLCKRAEAFSQLNVVCNCKTHYCTGTSLNPISRITYYQYEWEYIWKWCTFNLNYPTIAAATKKKSKCMR